MENVGSIIWKLCQLGVVLLLVGLAVLMVMKPEGEAEALANKNRAGEQVAGSGELAKSQQDHAVGHIDLGKLLDLVNVHKEIGMLAEGTTSIQQILFWEIVGDQVFYRIVLTPYDRPAHVLMMEPNEALFISFLTKDNKRVVPVSAPDRIATKTLRVATRDGYAAGWFHDGLLPLEGQDGGTIDHGKVGWIFSDTLHARLRKIQNPDRDGKTVTDPHGIKTGVEGK